MHKHIIAKLEEIEARSPVEDQIIIHALSMLREKDIGCHFNWLVQKDKDSLLELLKNVEFRKSY